MPWLGLRPDGSWSGLNWGSLAALIQTFVSDGGALVPDDFELADERESPAV